MNLAILRTRVAIDLSLGVVPVLGGSGHYSFAVGHVSAMNAPTVSIEKTLLKSTVDAISR